MIHSCFALAAGQFHQPQPVLQEAEALADDLAEELMGEYMSGVAWIRFVNHGFMAIFPKTNLLRLNQHGEFRSWHRWYPKSQRNDPRILSLGKLWVLSIKHSKFYVSESQWSLPILCIWIEIDCYIYIYIFTYLCICMSYYKCVYTRILPLWNRLCLAIGLVPGSLAGHAAFAIAGYLVQGLSVNQLRTGGHGPQGSIMKQEGWRRCLLPEYLERLLHPFNASCTAGRLGILTWP